MKLCNNCDKRVYSLTANCCFLHKNIIAILRVFCIAIWSMLLCVTSTDSAWFTYTGRYARQFFTEHRLSQAPRLLKRYRVAFHKIVQITYVCYLRKCVMSLRKQFRILLLSRSGIFNCYFGIIANDIRFWSKVGIISGSASPRICTLQWNEMEGCTFSKHP